jgi:hypothetical protein
MSKLTPEQIRRAEALAREIETGRQTHNEFGEFRDDVCDDEYSDDGYRLRWMSRLTYLLWACFHWCELLVKRF